MYSATDGINTASVAAPASGGLSPVGGQVSQAYPGDYSSPSVSGNNQVYTGSIPGSARTVSMPSSILGGAPVARQPLPAPSADVGNQAVATKSQAFPARPAASETASLSQTVADPVSTGTTPASGAKGWTGTSGTQVTVRRGETLYNLSRRYGVPVKEIMEANNITDANRVAAGQTLTIPSYVYSQSVPVSAPDANPKVAAARPPRTTSTNTPSAPEPQDAPSPDVAVLPQAPSSRERQAAEAQNAGSDANAASSNGNSQAQQQAAATAGGVYVVKSGDTLTRIAGAHGVSIDALKQANGLTQSTIRIGQQLKLPPAGAAEADPVQTASVQPKEDQPKAYTAPKPAAEAKAEVTETVKIDTNATAPASSGIDKLRWPARGQIITGYAKTENGRRNDGIDLSMPVGTAVKAAENGVVIYSGDGLKDYGNTVLVRHDDGLVTVYAHASELKVKRGDKVQRGQVIASSGMSGTAETPRLHFEVRKDATPVNPISYLE